ncbi:PREDICTED: DNA ligase 1 isoform X2 [Populus euphratica]|uniref:DNA ligase 1 isoform X2 n=1 Tax=Populus euphratica TaxID=75702 RepID=A0AAJ6UQ83_POPEU|nr:PREDICTED: DNA ligase 1 isoform X2 [Populus euphratica]
MKKKNPGNREDDKEKTNGPKSMMNKRKKNMKRLGGAAGLSLEAFVNAKANTSSSFSNPALIKKQREFYKNAKYVSKFKKKLKQQHQPNEIPSDAENENREGSKMMNKNKRSKNSLKELYEKRREEEEKAKIEREAILKAKKEERERSESRRKAAREKMFKKTRHGQPVMKYRIEHLLQLVQGSNENSTDKNL